MFGKQNKKKAVWNTLKQNWAPFHRTGCYNNNSVRKATSIDIVNQEGGFVLLSWKLPSLQSCYLSNFLWNGAVFHIYFKNICEQVIVIFFLFYVFLSYICVQVLLHSFPVYVTLPREMFLPHDTISIIIITIMIQWFLFFLQSQKKLFIELYFSNKFTFPCVFYDLSI